LIHFYKREVLMERMATLISTCEWTFEIQR